MRIRALGASALVAILALASSGRTVAGDAPAAAVGAPAPQFTLEDATGKSVSLADFKGKVVVLEWLNPDCPFVQRHYNSGTMARTADKYKGKDVVWLAINTTNSADKAVNAGWTSKHSLGYPILDDHEGKVGRLYGAKTTPHMYVVDPAGNLVYRGGIDDDPRGSKGAEAVNYVEKAVDEVLSGKPVSTPETKPYGCSVKYSA